MLRTFIAESYATQPLREIAAEFEEVMPDSTPADRLRCAQAPLLLADLVDAVEQVVVKSDDDAHVRGYAGGLLTYVYNPLDLLDADGAVGWLDDTIVCAEGLRRLHDGSHIQLDDSTLGLCDVARACEELLDDTLRGAIRDFVEGLWTNSGAVPAIKQS
jgi:uncharacterized membrane protein YkvA (DUF1232 family)